MALPSNWLFWLLFNVFVLAMLALDLGVFHREKRTVKWSEALGWTAFWIALAAAFATLIYFFGHTITGRHASSNPELTLQFVTGYIVELSLSVDNLFVFLLIFRYFRVPDHLQHKVLFWGVVGALLMRAIFIAAGVTLLNRFGWVIYVFAAILIYSGFKLLRQQGRELDPKKNPVLRGFQKMFSVTEDYQGEKFFVRRGARQFATPLAVVLLLVETTDVLFATDSIPAVLAVTREPFIVYTSNVFAILGLRSLYFALAGMIEAFHFLHYGLSVILVLIGVKMLLSNYVEIPTWIALAAVAGILAISVGLSVAFPKSD